MGKEQRQNLEKIRRECRIIFTTGLSEADWPVNHHSVFVDVQKIARIKYCDYAAEKQDPTNSHEPWKYHSKGLAFHLSEKAKLCVRRNEASWRFACEPLVFARFNTEVACPHCRKRVWRSEIEASPSYRSPGAEHLQRRQQNREPCRCPRSSRLKDSDEAIGLNRIFIDRADEFIAHDPELMNKLKKGEKPDRVYGLRQTRNLENLLHAPCHCKKLVREHLGSYPCADDGEPLLYPFLVVEAKSSKSDDDWHSIKLQTSFCVFTFLEAQRRLKVANGSRSTWHSGPLVWFLMSRGEDWRLCIAYQKRDTISGTSDSNFQTYITEIWKGCIEERDGALQLFLIVDYICDWARDIYRPAIHNELRLLAYPGSADVQTTYTDPDIFSSGDHKSSCGNIENDAHLGQSTVLDINHDFKALDNRYGVVRHSSFIASKYRALIITRDNIQTLLCSIQQNVLQAFCRQIISQVRSKNTLLTAKDLDAIEREWTGKTRTASPITATTANFYTLVTCTYYMNVSWEQVRELSVISVAEDSFDMLVSGSGLKAGNRKASRPRKDPLNGEHVIKHISGLKTYSVYQNLLAVINRLAVCVRNEKQPDRLGRSSAPIVARDSEAIIREIVEHTYKFFKKGRFEPDEPFLRISEKNIAQSMDVSLPESEELFGSSLFVSQSGGVLLHGEGHPHDAKWDEQSSLCVYLVNKSLKVPSTETLASIIKTTFEDHDVYHTTRDNGRPNIRGKTSKAPWNITNTYGVYFPYKDLSFFHWLKKLNVSPPTRQGSPRGESLSGNMLGRQYSPWVDSRKSYNSTRCVKSFKEFVLGLITSECQAWRSIARQRNQQSGRHCVLCAVKLKDTGAEAHTIACLYCHFEMHSQFTIVGPFLEAGYKIERRDERKDKNNRDLKSTFEFINETPQTYLSRRESNSVYSLAESDSDSDSDSVNTCIFNSEIDSDSRDATPQLPGTPLAPTRAASQALTPPDSKKRKLKSETQNSEQIVQVEENIYDAEG